MIGLCLAALFLGWSISRYVSRQTAVESQARTLAEAWLTLLAQGKLQQAHQLQAPPGQRVRSVQALEEYYNANSGARENLQLLLTSEPVKSFLAIGKDVRYRFDSIAVTTHIGGQDRLVFKYTFDDPTRQSPPTPMWIVVQREYNYDTKMPEWQITGVHPSAPR
jgi:hypothetical protein